MVVFAFVVVVVSFKEEGITWWLWWWCWVVVVVVVAAPPPPRRVDFLAPSRWRWWWFFSSFSSSSSFPVSVGVFETSRSCCFIRVYKREERYTLVSATLKNAINFNACKYSLSSLSSMSRLLERSRSSSIQSATKTTKLVRDFKWCKSFVFLFAFSPFLTGFRQKSLSLGHNEKSSNFALFSKVWNFVLFCLSFVLFSLCFLRNKTKKRGEDGQEKILFCSLTHFTRKRKGRKNSSHYEGRSAFWSALKVFFFSRGRFVLSSKELFSFSIIVLLYSKQ